MGLGFQDCFSCSMMEVVMLGDKLSILIPMCLPNVMVLLRCRKNHTASVAIFHYVELLLRIFIFFLDIWNTNYSFGVYSKIEVWLSKG